MRKPPRGRSLHRRNPKTPSSQPASLSLSSQKLSRERTLDGAWKLNPDESDDPREKARASSRRNGGGWRWRLSWRRGYPGVAATPVAGGTLGEVTQAAVVIQAVAVILGAVGILEAAATPAAVTRNGGPNDGDWNAGNNEKIQELIRPASGLTIARKDAEVDVTDEHFHKLVFYTDGRQLQKSTNANYQEIAAHWKRQPARIGRKESAGRQDEPDI